MKVYPLVACVRLGGTEQHTRHMKYTSQVCDKGGASGWRLPEQRPKDSTKMPFGERPVTLEPFEQCRCAQSVSLAFPRVACLKSV